MPFPRKFSVMVSYFYDFTIKEQACKADFACQRPNMPQGNRIPAPLPGAPVSYTHLVPPVTSASYYLILVIQGLMIGIYDSHLFFASGKYGSHASSGFMATCVLITVFLWWGIDFSELAALMRTPSRLITLMLILSGFSVSYWQMMKVRVSRAAEEYLYPAVFALALMSIATRYIALNGGTAYAGVVYYLTVACFVSGVYNAVMLDVYKRQAYA